MTSEGIPIILSCDDVFVPHAACTMRSVVQNSKRRYRFYILDSGISEANKAKLAAWDLGENTIQILAVEKDDTFKDIPLPRWLSQATLYRNRIPDLFPELPKAIYLDSDIVVVGDLGKLWDMNWGNKLMGVVYEDPFYTKRELSRHKRKLNLPVTKGYFNNGMLLMNLEALRAFAFTKKFILFFQEHTDCHLIGQDVQNILLDESQLLGLSPQCNVLVAAPYVPQCLPDRNLLCLHFNGPKPWHLYNWFVKLWPSFYCRCCRVYHRYIRLTPWKEEVNQFLTPYRFIKQVLHLIREWIQHVGARWRERLGF